MSVNIGRRQGLAFVAGLAAWPLAARGQRQSRLVIGYLTAANAPLAAFHDGLREAGYTEGQNVTIEYRSANGQYDRLPAMAAELVARRVDVIAASPTPAALAAKAATTTIPIVFSVGTDPVQAGLVASLNRPSGNLTGLSFFTFALMKKRIELLHDLVPQSPLVAVLVNPANENVQSDRKSAQEAALAFEWKIQIFDARTAGEIDAAFAALVQMGASALVLGNDPFFNSRRDQIAQLAIRHAIPTVVPLRQYVAAGGLMSYGARIDDTFRQFGVYIGRVLNGEKPGDLPVMLPSKFEFVINLQTARIIGIKVPPTLLALADEVIE
ncbi:MAG TPA: ABC transporter substrate-binding protein [Xanthobacteraceae bacterium]|jgi:putative ABC transport system substrate-binding protein